MDKNLMHELMYNILQVHVFESSLPLQYQGWVSSEQWP